MNIFFKIYSNKSKDSVLMLFYILLVNLLLSGCVTSRFNTRFQDPSFNFDFLKKAPSVIVGSPDFISVIDFNTAFMDIYQTNEAFTEKLVNNLTENLKSKGLDVIAGDDSKVYTKTSDGSYKYITSNNAKFIICIKSVDIYSGVVGSPNSYSVVYEVDLGIVIMDLDTKKILTSFEAKEKTTNSGLKYAVEKATKTLALKLLSEKQ